SSIIRVSTTSGSLRVTMTSGLLSGTDPAFPSLDAKAIAIVRVSVQGARTCRHDKFGVEPRRHAPLEWRRHGERDDERESAAALSAPRGLTRDSPRVRACVRAAHEFPTSPPSMALGAPGADG